MVSVGFVLVLAIPGFRNENSVKLTVMMVRTTIDAQYTNIFFTRKWVITYPISTKKVIIMRLLHPL
jgi:hypothetical protein